MLPQALKLKVIQQHEAGKLQKDIAHDLGISTGSVSMILKASKEKHSDSIPREQPSVVAIDTVLKPAYSDLQSQPPSSYKKEPVQQQPSPVISSSSFLPSVPSRSVQAASVTVRRDGGPLTHFFSGKDEDTMMTVPDSISSADGSPAPLKVDDADVINSPEEPNPPYTPSDLTYSPGWDPDDEQAMRTRFLRAIIAEREKRDQVILLINKEKELIAYERRNLETGLQEVEKYRDILPSAKQLREMGVDLVGVSIWIEVIRDKAATERITPKEAVALIVQELKLYNQFNSLKRSVERAQQDLDVLNIAVEQTQQAYRSLVDLRSKGISDTEIIELNKLVNSWSAGGGRSQNNWLNLRLDEKLNLASHH